MTVPAAKELVEESGKIFGGETLVICIAGNGLKTTEAVSEYLSHPIPTKQNIESFESLLCKINQKQ